MLQDIALLSEIVEQDLENINGGAVSITNTIVTAPTPQYQVLLQKIISELDHKQLSHDTYKSYKFHYLQSCTSSGTYYSIFERKEYYVKGCNAFGRSC